jgi:hypothetical protein
MNIRWEEEITVKLTDHKIGNVISVPKRQKKENMD